MRIVSFDGFAVKGSASVDGGGVMLGIAPSSEIDRCLVGGKLLGPQSIVPFDPTVQAIRSYRLQGFDTPDPDQPCGRLDLVVYDSCDELSPPGPRAITERHAFLPGPNLGATAATAIRIMRLPFQGRRQATFQLRRYIVAAALDFNIVIRGVRYFSRELNALIRGTGVTFQQPFLDELTDTYFGGAGAPPVSTISGATDYPSGQTVTGAADGIGRTIYVGGGGDLQEDYDELELLVYGTAYAGGHIVAYGASYGERAT